MKSRIVDRCEITKWCPGKRCGQIIRLHYKDSKLGMHNAECSSCHYHFCTKCHGEAHRPLKCELYKEWSKLTKLTGKVEDKEENLTEEYLKTFTK